MSYDNTNSGALFKNDKQGNDKRPDYKGQINVDGKDYEIAAWLSESKKGTKYMRLKVQEPRQRSSQQDDAPPAPPPDDVPF